MDTTKFVPILVQVSNHMAVTEGLTEEEAIINRSNEIFQDAQLPEPTTEAGKYARAEALQKLKELGEVNLADAKQQAEKFNYVALRDKAAMGAIPLILKKISEVSDELPTAYQSTAEEQKKYNSVIDKLTYDIFPILTENGAGLGHYKYIFDLLKQIISDLYEHNQQQINGHTHEFMSRAYGAKNPGTGKFDATYATYDDLKNARQKAKEETGNDDKDYFSLTSSDEE